MATALTVVPATLPEGTCYSTEQERLNGIAANLLVSIPGTLSLFNFGASTPALENRDRPWIRLNPDGSVDDIYVFYNGSWRKKFLPFTTGDVMFFSGSEASIVDPWFVCNGQTVARALGNFVTPDLRQKFVLVSGTGGTVPDPVDGVGTVALTQRILGQTGGAEEIILLENQTPTHEHAVWGADTTAVGTVNTGLRRVGCALTGATGNPNAYIDEIDGHSFTQAAGGDQPHPNMGPFYVLAAKVYVQPD
jgi:microcystin-dependent protein